MTFPCPTLQSGSAVIASLEVAEPPADKLTLVGLKDVVNPDGALAEKLTVPEKPLTLVTVIVV